MATEDIPAEGVTITIPHDPNAVTIERTPAAAAQAPGGATASPASDAPEVGIEDLKRQLAERDAMIKASRDAEQAARRAHAEADRRAQDAMAQASQARSVADERGYDSIVNALSRAETEYASLEAQLVAKHETGDFAGAAKVQGEMGKLAARLAQFENAKGQIEAQREAAKTAPPQQRQMSPHEQREAFIANCTPPTAAWLRQNPGYFDDAALQSRVNGAHGYVANTLGIAADTPEYFAKIEELAGMRQAPLAPAAQQPAAAQAYAPARPTVPAAAPSRSVPTSAPNTGGTQVTLTPEERQIARLTMTPDVIGPGVDPEVAYARQKQAIIASGQADRFRRA